jgi:hypothetical protein
MQTHTDSLVDYQYFLKLHPTKRNAVQASNLLFFEINLLNYRSRFYSNINLYVVQYLLQFAQINHIIQPLYIHKPTLLFHAIYIKHVSLINLCLSCNPKHYIHNTYPTYSLLTALHTQHLPTIKAIIPHTDIHFQINNTTPYQYSISHFESSHPIHILFEYINLHKSSLRRLILHTKLPIDNIQQIKTYLI